MKIKYLTILLLLFSIMSCKKNINYSNETLNRSISNRKYSSLFRRAMNLYDSKNYKTSYQTLNKIPEQYSKLEIIYWKGKCLENLRRYNSAIDTFEKAFYVKDNRKRLKGYLNYSYLELICKHQKITDISSMKINKIKKYLKKNHIMKKQINKKLSGYYEHLFYNSLYKKDYNEMERTYKRFWKFSNPKLWMYRNEFGKDDYQVLINSIKYWDLRKYSSKSAQKHRIQVIYFKHLDTRNMRKESLREYESLTQKEISSYKKVFEIMKKFYFYISNGKLLLEFKYKTVKSTITNLKLQNYRSRFENYKFYRFDIDDINPYPSSVFMETVNKTDSYIYITPTKNIRTSFAMKDYVNITRSQRSNSKKGIMVFGAIRSRNPITLIHEFFHVVEDTYGIGPIHIFKENFNSVWPNWYKGQGQLFYYKNMFRKKINRLGVSRMSFL